ncbi:AAA family ATPase [Pseudenhygromyxa sp. WMMC2535]|uniref:nucleotide-binding protein n=1 Tax=Pseudenhygromyxa sp. WMMC2535 TaxID=2712867 RepID=UPI0015551547|nr:AAA family ATPase [Pseudenhygromyxa sp. WMMC2535]NVB41913.1 AAA family ATPase [Pseudenhygromyxa sp. WMMC2535]
MLLALAGLKGGTGRTTLAVALAAEAHARGRRTLLVDLDPRGDAHAWSRSAAENPTPPALALPGSAPGQAERLRALSFGHDLTVVDTPSDPEILAAVLEVAELALIPCRPSPLDVWAAVDVAQACLDARRLNPRLQFAMVPNAVDARTTLSAALPRDLRTMGLPVLDVAIARRVAHAEAMAHGSTASLDAPGSAAGQDVAELFDAVEALQAHCTTARLYH